MGGPVAGGRHSTPYEPGEWRSLASITPTAAARGRRWRTRHRRSCWGATVECIENASMPQRWRREGEQAPAEIPQGLIGQLFEMEADYAEVLWALDQPPGSLNTSTQFFGYRLPDGRGSVTALAHALRKHFRRCVDPCAIPRLARTSPSVAPWTRGSL